MLFCKGRQVERDRRGSVVVRQRAKSLCARLMIAVIVWLTGATTQAEFGDQSLGWTREQEAAVAAYLQRRLQRQGVLINDVWLEYWLAERAQRLRQVSPSSLGPVHVVVVNDRDFNAFALPGNVMGFNLGLWRTAQSEGELVSVMAHEMAHLSLRHFNRLSQNNRQQAWIALSGALLGIALAGVNPELAGAAFAGSQAGALQKGLSFSRSMETEADRVSAELLGEIGYSPTAGAKIFQRLQQEVAFNPDASEYWQTHPRPSNRVARLDTREESDATGQEPAPDHQFEVLRWYVNHRHFSGDDFQPIPSRLTSIAADSPQLPDGLLVAAEPNLIYGWIQASRQAGHDNHTEAHLQALVELFPDFDPGWHHLATLSARRQDETGTQCRQALAYLREIDTPYLQVLEMRRTLTQQCQRQREAEATAEWLWFRGEEERAMTALRRAIDTPESTTGIARLRDLLSRFERQLTLLPD